MTDWLLRILSNADIDWMIASGDRHTLAAGQSLLHSSAAPEWVSIIVEGRLGVAAAQGAVDGAVLIDQLNQGDIVGFSPLLDEPNLTAVTALVLSLSVPQLRAKLSEDVAFAAHIYHVIALQLSDRLRRIFEHPSRLRFWGGQSGNDVLTVFGELRDSDIDWLTAFGAIATIPADRVLLQAGRPVESFYILLEGQMAMSASQDSFNPLALCFLDLEKSTREPVFATLNPGSMPGMMSFLDFRPLPVTVRATTASLVFALPRQALANKLQVDDSFACRFYRVIAMGIMAQHQTVSMGLVEPGAAGQAMDGGGAGLADGVAAQVSAIAANQACHRHDQPLCLARAAPARGLLRPAVCRSHRQPHSPQ